MIEIQQLYEKYLNSSGVSTDTRKIASNSLFFALTGENFDGNSFAAEALKAGAKYVVVDNPEVVESSTPSASHQWWTLSLRRLISKM